MCPTTITDIFLFYSINAYFCISFMFETINWPIHSSSLLSKKKKKQETDDGHNVIEEEEERP